MDKGFTKIPHIFVEMLSDKVISSQEFSFLCLVSKYSSMNNGCRSAVSYIKCAIGVSPQTIRKLRKSLLDKKLIETDVIQHTTHYKLINKYDKFSRIPNSLFTDMASNKITRNEFNLLVVVARYHYRDNFSMSVDTILELSERLNVGLNTAIRTSKSTAKKGYIDYTAGSKYSKAEFKLTGTTQWTILSIEPNLIQSVPDVPSIRLIPDSIQAKAMSVSEEYKNDCEEFGVDMFDCIPDFIKQMKI